MPARRIDDHVGRLDVLVDEPTSVKLAESGGQGHREPEEASDLHRLANEAIQGLTTGVVDNQHRPAAFAHEFHRP